MATQPLSFRSVRRYVATVAAALLCASMLTACATFPLPNCHDCGGIHPTNPNP